MDDASLGGKHEKKRKNDIKNMPKKILCIQMEYCTSKTLRNIIDEGMILPIH